MQFDVEIREVTDLGLPRSVDICNIRVIKTASFRKGANAENRLSERVKTGNPEPAGRVLHNRGPLIFNSYYQVKVNKEERAAS